MRSISGGVWPTARVYSGQPRRPPDIQGMTTASAASPVERRLAELVELEHPQAHVRTRLGLPVSDRGVLERVAERYCPPVWAVGCVSVYDAAFLYDFVRALRPRRVVELGVASGGSTSLLLTAIADAGIEPVDERGEPTLQSFDLHPWCYFDRSRAVGSAVQEMAPELAHGLRLHTGKTAADAGRMLAPDSVPLAFIDADHRHPSPTADLLGLMPVLEPDAWVVLHDIMLAEAARRTEAKRGIKVDYGDQHGPEWLFERWPWEKIRGGTEGDRFGAANIGAIRLPGRKPRLEEFAELIALPWETTPEPRALAALGRTN